MALTHILLKKFTFYLKKLEYVRLTPGLTKIIPNYFYNQLLAEMSFDIQVIG